METYEHGLYFTLGGDLGGCLLYLDIIEGGDEGADEDPCRGTCQDGPACAPPTAPITQFGTMLVPNMSFFGGHTAYNGNSSKLIGFRWRLFSPTASMGCQANITIQDAHMLVN